MNAARRIFVALDVPDADRARDIVRTLAGRVGGFKIGLELFTAAGPSLVRETVDAGQDVFLDLKLHDIPNTVAGASAAAARLGVSFLTVHALGGARMIRQAAEAAAEAAERLGGSPPVLLAVTVLTSHDDADLGRLGIAGPCGAAVVRLAALAREAGAGGVVCSPQEISAVRPAAGPGLVVVPGIRPASASVGSDDQQRTSSPARALALGADRLVIGRPITRAEDPVGAVRAILQEIETGEGE